MSYDVTMPDGTVIQGVPEGTTKAQLAQKYQAHIGGQKQTSTPQANQAIDALRSIPGALLKGVTGIVGLPGDIEKGLTYAADKVIGVPENQRQEMDAQRDNLGGVPAIPTSAGLNNAVSAPFGGMYEPKTTAGKYADTIGQFAPAAAAPGSVVLRLARAIVPGALSEAGGQAAEGTPLEIPARLGGALLGAGAIGGVRQLGVPRPEAPPTTAELRAQSSRSYDRAHAAGVVVPQDRVQALGAALRGDLRTQGLDPTLHPRVTAALGRLEGVDSPASLQDIDILRRVAGGAAGSIDRDERRLGRALVGGIDDFVENLGPSDVLSGNAPEATQALGEARGLYRRTAKSETIDRLLERSQNRAETVGGSGLENAVRVEFRNLAQNDKRMRGFSQAEQDAIRDVARGGAVDNAARLLGKFAVRGPVGGIASAAAAVPGFAAGGPLGAIALPLAGEVGRGAATAMTMRRARLAGELMRRGEQAPAIQQVWAPELLSAILDRNRRESQPQMPAMAGAY